MSRSPWLLGQVTYFDHVSHKLRDYNLLLDCLHNQLVNSPTDIKGDKIKKNWYGLLYVNKQNGTEVT